MPISVSEVFYGEGARSLITKKWLPSLAAYPTDTTKGVIWIAQDAGSIGLEDFIAGDSVHYANGSWLRFGSSGDQFLFSRIAISGQSDVIAHTTGDTLTLVAGTGITITTDTSTNTITFSTSGVTSTTGTLISFAAQTIYNTPASPATGNITDDLTGAKPGIVQKIYHNNSTEPNFPAGWVKLGSGAYVTGTLNIIFCEWVGASRVEYWVTQ